MKTSEDGQKRLRDSEGLRLDAYKDRAGVWTIGYGDTGHVKEGDRITAEEAERRFATRLVDFEAIVVRAVTVPLRQGQFDALVSLAYNIGVGAFGSSRLVKAINANDIERAAQEFVQWIHRRGPLVTVKRGDSGDAVGEWQRTLVDAGYPLKCDRDFGNATELATTAWQVKHGHLANGIGSLCAQVVDPDLLQRRVSELVRFLSP
jgi:lysozyme